MTPESIVLASLTALTSNRSNPEAWTLEQIADHAGLQIDETQDALIGLYTSDLVHTVNAGAFSAPSYRLKPAEEKPASDFIVVEKTDIDLASGISVNLFALCASKPIGECYKYSPTFDGYLSPWTANRGAVEASI